MMREASILTVNGGSSSIKFALYRADETLKRTLHGKIERIGLPDARLVFEDVANGERTDRIIAANDYRAATDLLVEWCDARIRDVAAVGHRIVHGMQHAEPERVTPQLLDELHRIVAYDPDHLPYELGLVHAFRRRWPELPQTVCFDTAFHRTMPRVARMLPIPRRYDKEGLQRYGFHGLSYAYLIEELQRIAGADAAGGRVIIAHLGNGASVAALHGGRSIDTTMGFTPAGGIPMGERPGDLDPGVAWWLIRAGHLSPSQFNDLINHHCGLLGVSQTSADMRDLLAREADDVRAAEAVDLFCYQAKKAIGALAAALGGVDTLVFSGGIGENAPQVRERICADLTFLGIAIDREQNARNGDIISPAGERVLVRVVHTDEELMIARAVCRVLGLTTEYEHEHSRTD
ncbi:MAG TPA: acetate/propionate family kinase [Burkholderiales bacterium]|nr:acetate/propionate family kinase [Burkholderiales bacterium]